MIDVPIAVRDALKDGGYKKNYRFVVGAMFEEPIFLQEASLEVGTPYTIVRDGYFRLYNDYHMTGFTYRLNAITHTVNSMVVEPSGKYYYNLGNLTIGDEIEIISAYYTLDLRIKTDQTEEVFVHDLVIENDKLVKESVKIDERMCSDDNLKFGLCEGSGLEFQAFNIDNITGRRIQAFIDVEYPEYYYEYDEETDKTTKTEVIETFSIPMGWYDVQETSRQASTGIRKVSAYNKLKSEYLDTEVNALIVEEFGTATVRMIDILTYLLRKYGIKSYDTWVLSYTYKYSNQPTEPKRYFSPFKYTDYSSSSMGAFTSYPFYNGGPDKPLPLNKNIYMEGVFDITRYYLWSTVYIDAPIQVRVSEDVEQIDTLIANYIQDQLTLLEPHCDKTAADMWASLKNMTAYYSDGKRYLYGYFFYVRIAFKDGHSEIYGNNVPNADGTFAQLGRKTFLNVTNVYIVTPVGIRYGTQFDSGTTQYLAPVSYDGYVNYVPLTGGEQDQYRIPPRRADGSEIPRDILNYFTVRALTGSYTPADLIEVEPTKMASVTLRDLQTAVFEMNCQFGRLDRTSNYFTGVELNKGRLYPHGDDTDLSIEALYPADDLYPQSTSESGFRAMYSKLWADEGNIRSWRYLIVTYKGLIEDEETHEKSEADKIYQVTIDANGTDDYEVKDNWLFKNLLWADAESASWTEAQGLERIETYADAMVDKMTGISWFPFEMWCAGLPYVETGDEVEINIGNHAYNSYVLRRTIKGIQNLQDEMINGTLDIF